eukprot:c39172_g1_i1.p1 GENE.c39172_g1_i1~~c39172_g1_i1.p1  ORF type:complete len:497 (-),score=107.92 c39172_g1_i1:48-1538(-)
MGAVSNILQNQNFQRQKPTNMSSNVVLNFSSTDLASWLHGLPRYNHTLDRVTNQFTYDDRQYYEGVVMMLIPFLAMAVVTILFFLIRCVIVCAKCCCHREQKFQPKPRCLLYTFLVTCFIVIGGLIYGFIANQQVSRGIDEIRDAVDDMQTFGDDTVDGVRIIRDQVLIVSDSATQLSNLVTSFGLGTINEIDQISSLLSDASSVLDSGIDTYNDIPLAEVNARMDQYDGYRWAAQLGLLIFLSAPYWMVLFGIACKCKCLVWNVTWVAVLCAVIAWVLSGAESVVTVILGDLCFNATGYALDRGRDLGSSAFDFIEYYIICTGIRNPLQPQIDQANSALAQIQAPVLIVEGVLTDALVATLINQLEFDQAAAILLTISTATNTTIVQVEDIINTVFRCETPHNSLVKALDGVCNTALSGFFGLIVVQVLLALCFWVAIVCSLYLLGYLKNRDAPQASGDEPAGLAKSLSFMYGKPQEATPLNKEVELPPLSKDAV